MRKQILFGGMVVLWAGLGFIACNPTNNEKQNKTETVAYPASPDVLLGDLFDAVQMQEVFPDGKTFADCTPKRKVEDIVNEYAKAKNTPGFDLKKFVSDNFDLPAQPAAIAVQQEKDIRKHIEDLWPLLSRQPGTVVEGSSLLALPDTYIVPGGRFREVYYWDSYFTMLGLRLSGRVDIIENMVANFAYLINTYGHIPNGNRTYYLTRSQPPFFSMMVQLLAEAKKDDKVYDTYFDAIEKEYMYWMAGDRNLNPGEEGKKVIITDGGAILNHYFDEASTPRPESYREDVLTANEATEKRIKELGFTTQAKQDSFAPRHKARVYRHLRAAAESGWDFSSRWMTDPKDLGSIETTKIVPVDLNCLLYFTENLLGKLYRKRGNTLKADEFKKWAKERSDAIIRYCYNPKIGFFTDYHWGNKAPTDKVTAAGLFPLFFLDSALLADKIPNITKIIETQLLSQGGILTTPVNSGQQWDAPNGWAPLQWIAVNGLEKNGQYKLAKEIGTRWIKLNADVFSRTGKLMEKYNVVNTTLDAGGGEYPGQDGFGWTNGVLLGLMEMYKEPAR
jgi:alpha,alpha-trehalase